MTIFRMAMTGIFGDSLDYAPRISLSHSDRIMCSYSWRGSSKVSIMRRHPDDDVLWTCGFSHWYSRPGWGNTMSETRYYSISGRGWYGPDAERSRIAWQTNDGF